MPKGEVPPLRMDTSRTESRSKEVKSDRAHPANIQDRANVGHQLTGLAKRRQICQRFANVANALPTSLQKP